MMTMMMCGGSGKLFFYMTLLDTIIMVQHFSSLFARLYILIHDPKTN